MSQMIPKYSTKTFTEVWDNVDDFVNDYKASPFYNAVGQTLEDSYLILNFYLLYNRYGNTPIANEDENQFKFKTFGIIMQYGPTWATKLKIQAKLRQLGIESDSEIYKGSKAIYNHAFNPETQPKTGDLDEIDYINDQNTTIYKKSVLEGLALLAESLRDDVSSSYIDKFRKLYKQFFFPIRHTIYVTEEEEDEDNEDER